MCHHYKSKDCYGSQDAPKKNTKPYDEKPCKTVEPLPESTRERRDGPGGE